MYPQWRSQHLNENLGWKKKVHVKSEGNTPDSGHTSEKRKRDDGNKNHGKHTKIESDNPVSTKSTTDEKTTDKISWQSPVHVELGEENNRASSLAPPAPSPNDLEFPVAAQGDPSAHGTAPLRRNDNHTSNTHEALMACLTTNNNTNKETLPSNSPSAHGTAPLEQDDNHTSNTHEALTACLTTNDNANKETLPSDSTQTSDFQTMATYMDQFSEDALQMAGVEIPHFTSPKLSADNLLEGDTTQALGSAEVPSAAIDTKTKKRKYIWKPGNTKNGCNLCAIHWVKHNASNGGGVADFKKYYDTLTMETRKLYDDKAATLVSNGQWKTNSTAVVCDGTIY